MEMGLGNKVRTGHLINDCVLVLQSTSTRYIISVSMSSKKMTGKSSSDMVRLYRASTKHLAIIIPPYSILT